MGEVGKIIAQMGRWVWMGMGLIVPPLLLLSLFEVPFLGRLGIIVVCVHSSAFDHR